MINELKLDLACGQNKTEGYFGIDIAPGDKVDAVVDLEQFPWPIESDSAEDIVCSHYVEHTTDLIKFMDEVYRILKPGGKIKIIAPYYTSIRCWQDPTHKRAISDATFLYCGFGVGHMHPLIVVDGVGIVKVGNKNKIICQCQYC